MHDQATGDIQGDLRDVVGLCQVDDHVFRCLWTTEGNAVRDESLKRRLPIVFDLLRALLSMM